MRRAPAAAARSMMASAAGPQACSATTSSGAAGQAAGIGHVGDAALNGDPAPEPRHRGAGGGGAVGLALERHHAAPPAEGLEDEAGGEEPHVGLARGRVDQGDLARAGGARERQPDLLEHGRDLDRLLAVLVAQPRPLGRDVEVVEPALDLARGDAPDHRGAILAHGGAGAPCGDGGEGDSIGCDAARVGFPLELMDDAADRAALVAALVGFVGQ